MSMSIGPISSIESPLAYFLVIPVGKKKDIASRYWYRRTIFVQIMLLPYYNP